MLSFGTCATKVFGSANDRKLKPYASRVAAISSGSTSRVEKRTGGV